MRESILLAILTVSILILLVLHVVYVYKKVKTNYIKAFNEYSQLMKEANWTYVLMEMDIPRACFSYLEDAEAIKKAYIDYVTLGMDLDDPAVQRDIKKLNKNFRVVRYKVTRDKDDAFEDINFNFNEFYNKNSGLHSDKA